MPRLHPSLFQHAKQLSPHIATLLPACRDLQSAVNELRWLKGHVDETKTHQKAAHLKELCRKRGQGVPLQYILGSQPFGSLDIKCRPGVLIPRPETEAYTCHLVDLIKSGELLGQGSGGMDNSLNVIDFCTGTGCIPLLLFSYLQRSFTRLIVRGVDISPQALQLANENIAHNITLGNFGKPTNLQNLNITRDDVFSDSDIHNIAQSHWDVLVSNPPYISKDVWNCGRSQLGPSVRKYEPRLALVPDDNLPRLQECDHADVFYARLLDIASLLKPKVILLEIGDEDQARRVLQLFARHKIAQSSQVELWRDWPDFEATEEDERGVEIGSADNRSWRVPAKGSGLVRSIFIQRVKNGDTQ
ncbi:Fc.00g051090.m01.CDS01 [Cosmosporella sp. VM-42]